MNKATRIKLFLSIVTLSCLSSFDTNAQVSTTFDNPDQISLFQTFKPQYFTPTISEGKLNFTLNPERDLGCIRGGCFWFGATSAGMLYQTVSNDFDLSSTVHARKVGDPNACVGDNTRYQLAGIIARDPSASEENYVFIVVGLRDNRLSIETKNTRNGSSQVEFVDWASCDAELRITRTGQTFRLYARPVGGSTWTLLREIIRGTASTGPVLSNTLQVGMISYTYQPYTEAPNLIEATFDHFTFAGNPGNALPTSPILSSGNVTNNSIELNWTASNDPDGSVVGYEIYRDGNNNPYQVINNPLQVNYIDNGLASGESHTYSIRAKDNQGAFSAMSNVVSATTLNSAPITPNNFEVNSLSSNSATFAWQAATDPDDNLQQYEIFRNNELLQTITNLTQLSYSDNTIVSGQSYVYKIRARDSGGLSSAFSSDVLVVPPPTAPVLLGITHLDRTGITLHWQAIPGAIEYEVHTSGGFLQTTDQLYFTHTGFPENTEIQYFIKAVNAADVASSESNTIQIITPCASPFAATVGAPFMAYPNTFKDQIQLVMKGPQKGEVVQVLLTDAFGREVFNTQLSQNTQLSLDLSHLKLSQGLYFVHMRFANGKAHVIRVVKGSVK
ncbi:MAG TPA: hypothetical protein DCS93_24455 [Microscillaceae bacterium]|nr:hypothetical protein [Microscillaceae bacterium]